MVVIVSDSSPAPVSAPAMYLRLMLLSWAERMSTGISKMPPSVPSAVAGSGGAGSPMTQLPSPLSSVSSRISTSRSRNSWISGGPDTSDKTPTVADRWPISAICGPEPQSALDRLTSSALIVSAGSTRIFNSPSMPNSRPVASLTSCSICGLKRPKSTRVSASNRAITSSPSSTENHFSSVDTVFLPLALGFPGGGAFRQSVV